MWLRAYDKQMQTEADALNQLNQLKRDLLALQLAFQHLPARADYEQIAEHYSVQQKQLALKHQGRKAQRDRSRLDYSSQLQGNALMAALEKLNQESQQDGMERRRLKQAQAQALSPIAQVISESEAQIKRLKQQYKTLSREWQTQLQAAYFSEQARAEQAKAKQAKAKQAKAKQARGEASFALRILYQDEALIIVDKPAGLLSVPGRRYHSQDSVLSRLRYQLPQGAFVQAVHRLDEDTSGVLAIATSAEAHAALSRQFALRQVHKTYEAVLSRPVDRSSGTVELPLWGNPKDRPRQSVDFQQGKPSRTEFRVIMPGEQPRVELIPHTGRTHQLRVHMADEKGLNSPVLGDRLYGKVEEDFEGKVEKKREGEREQPKKQYYKLYLHATRLEIVHPMTNKTVCFSSSPPF
ncbi:MAG: tRNA pseudouridine32 synthase / 23S rRNA pseudouridine746 synthase [Phormidesmis priestleyi Ana]|uniref:RNA pseudouridylate synthase n=1 Tax=Phormidesmis priestleyi Ana TaxID=1666911 RepID=A0A0P8C073_9CYAN|nr:MAG: tRNA pseudouridine32 synthase / 23S rRNA pseudouridine746 synthase [Phormidesmis priestleyi Ana]